METNFDSIEQLKKCLREQFEAHINEDWDLYDNMEERIKLIEKDL